MLFRVPAALALVAVLAGAAACNEGSGTNPRSDGPPGGRVDREPPPTAGRYDGATGGPLATCAPAAANCRTATGRVVYVEAVDPDGDGDAHLVLASADSVTAPGISVIDVAAELRPDPLPGIGDRVSAAGPVYRGSYGQRQIQASSIAVGEGR